MTYPIILLCILKTVKWGLAYFEGSNTQKLDILDVIFIKIRYFWTFFDIFHDLRFTAVWQSGKLRSDICYYITVVY